MAEPIGVGVIGAGYWGQKLVGEYLSAEQRNNKIKLVKVCDKSLSALLACEKKFSLHYGLLTQKPECLIDSPKISAVHVASPNHTHYAMAKMALEAGKHVLVEKPMTLNSAEAYELVKLAASKQLALSVGHIFRFNSALQTARNLLQNGWPGKIFYARVQWTDYLPPFQDRDIIFDLGPHPVDILNLLLDAWPLQASGFSRAYRNSGGHEEVAYVIAEFQGGLFAHIELSWLHPRKVREVSIVGSAGTLVVDCANQRVLQFRNGETIEVPVTANNTIATEIDQFISSIEQRDTSSESGRIGARTVEVLETIRESMWQRPLPVLQPVDDTATMLRVLEMASSTTKPNKLLNNRITGNNRLEKFAGILLRSGLLRTILTPEGEGYEITELGSRFLREYQEIQREILRRDAQISEAT